MIDMKLKDIEVISDCYTENIGGYKEFTFKIDSESMEYYVFITSKDNKNWKISNSEEDVHFSDRMLSRKLFYDLAVALKADDNDTVNTIYHTFERFYDVRENIESLMPQLIEKAEAKKIEDIKKNNN